MAAVRPSRRRGRQASWWRAKTWVRRHVLHSDGFALLTLSACAAASGALFLTDRSWFPLTTLALVVLAGGFLLTVRSLLILDVVVATVIVFEVVRATDRRCRRAPSWWSRSPRPSCTPWPGPAGGWVCRGPVVTRCWSTCGTG
jgi:hypothetical protein